MRSSARFVTFSALTAALVSVQASCSASGSPELRIASVSARPHLVTGGDVLLRVELVGGIDPSEVEVLANGSDVTARFQASPQGSSLLGLVDGLPEGASEIEARIVGGELTSTLALTNYPIWGPIISGPHEKPFLCQTEDFLAPNGQPLGPPLDEHCSTAERVDYVYLSKSHDDFMPYTGAERSQVVEVTTLDGETVPFIVRVETGTVNRAIYQIALLHDPADPDPSPWSRSRGWNGKLVYTHGGGCRSGWYRQGESSGPVLQRGLLEMGYALTSSSLNVFGQNCNDLLASETHIMVKEQFVERYGAPTYTIGTGGSGGSYQSHQTADNYPGVFDGIIVSSSFPDVTSATIFTLADSRLLHHYFTLVAPGAFSQEQQRQIAGFGSWGSIANLSRGAARLDPTYSEGAAPEMQGAEVGGLAALEKMRYSPSTPEGIRATVYDHTANVYGSDPKTGFAARPLDNYGVQYGLGVLNQGQITKAQFLALNRDIGGFDDDLNHMPQRHRADPTAARRAIDTGRVLFGGGGLASTPIIDFRSYTDHREGGDIHMMVHQFSTRARLISANGHADNQVMNIGGEWGYTEERPDLGVLFRYMDVWLLNLVGTDSFGPRSDRVVPAKPQGLVDNCWDTRGEQRVQSTFAEGACQEIYPPYYTPRHVAGAGLQNDVVSCRLKPLDVGDYTVTFTDEEWSELERIFPDGVCDWTRRDAHSQGYQGTWLSFGPSPVNRAR